MRRPSTPRAAAAHAARSSPVATPCAAASASSSFRFAVASPRTVAAHGRRGVLQPDARRAKPREHAPRPRGRPVAAQGREALRSGVDGGRREGARSTQNELLVVDRAALHPLRDARVVHRGERRPGGRCAAQGAHEVEKRKVLVAGRCGPLLGGHRCGSPCTERMAVHTRGGVCTPAPVATVEAAHGRR